MLLRSLFAHTWPLVIPTNPIIVVDAIRYTVLTCTEMHHD